MDDRWHGSIHVLVCNGQQLWLFSVKQNKNPKFSIQSVKYCVRFDHLRMQFYQRWTWIMDHSVPNHSQTHYIVARSNNITSIWTLLKIVCSNENASVTLKSRTIIYNGNSKCFPYYRCTNCRTIGKISHRITKIAHPLKINEFHVCTHFIYDCCLSHTQFPHKNMQYFDYLPFCQRLEQPVGVLFSEMDQKQLIRNAFLAINFTHFSRVQTFCCMFSWLSN